jgi:hypothetical protein
VTSSFKDVTLRKLILLQICDAKAQLKTDSESTGSVSQHEIGENIEFVPLRPVLRDNHIALQTNDTMDIAVLDNASTKALFDSDTDNAIICEVFAVANELSTSLSLWRNKGSVEPFTVELTLYGKRRNCDHIGRVFSDAGLFLQHPRRLHHSVPYDNPHFLQLPQTIKTFDYLPTPSLTPQAISMAPSILDTVLNDLDQSNVTEEIQVDDAIATTLQKYAFHRFCFIILLTYLSKTSDLRASFYSTKGRLDA